MNWNIKIRPAAFSDVETVADLAAKLWSDHAVTELIEEFKEELRDGTQFFLAEMPEVSSVKCIGFAQCCLRHDYVEGTQTSPVGYLEGIFVDETVRGNGISHLLLAAAEQWAREQGCTEFASDCELSNTVSQAFHLRNGFTEANRIVCYTKHL